MDIRNFNSVKARREFIQENLGVDLPNIGSFTISEEIASSKNCENMIGAVQIPVGIAGPLKFANEKEEIYLPLATTEGALVASINRGMKAISESGGTNVVSYEVGITRGPVFYTGSVIKSNELFHWIKENEEKIRNVAQKTSDHLKLKKIMVRTSGIYVFLRFHFDTSDAMGMNMATIATTAITEFIQKEVGVKLISVAGNYDIDKKPAWLNFINHRGIKVWADVIISKKTLADVLKTTPEKFFETWLAKCMIGSVMSGSLGFNAHFANVVAAIFIATGQDPAEVVDGSLGITTAKVLPNEELLVSIYMPALEIGTVGGGTNLDTQKEALEIMGIYGSGNKGKFAKIIAGAVLAGELSLISSLAENSLAQAHKDLARGGK